MFYVFPIMSLRAITEIQRDLLVYYHYLDEYPNDEQIYVSIARLLCEQEDFSLALLWYERALEKKPFDQSILFSYATALLGAGKLHESIQAFENVKATSALYNTAYIMKLMGHEYPELLDEAIEIFQKIIQQHPDYNEAQLALGFAYLMQGDFDRGWHQHQHYLKRAGKNADALRHLLQTQQLEGSHVLLTYEGGFGDSIQCIRYARLLKNRGARVTAFVQKPLKTLFSYNTYIDEIITDKAMLKTYNASAPLMSLPAIFWGQDDAFASEVPYLSIPQELISHWGTILKSYSGLKVGIFWQPDVFNDSSRQPIARRGIPLALLTPLMQKYNSITFFSLQKQEGVEQITNDTVLVVYEDDFDESRGSFMDSAALIMHCDLIITSDSAIAHLAGALARPVWLLLPYATDWRWICGRNDSPWYPTMRIFKQPKPFDWDSVIMQLDQELSIITQ